MLEPTMRRYIWTSLFWFFILQLPLACSGGGSSGESKQDDERAGSQPVVEWRSPTTDVELLPGDSIELQWQSQELGDRRLELAFSVNASVADSAWEVIANNLTGTTNSWTWSAPDLATTNGRWRLRSLDNAVVALSPAGFSIDNDDDDSDEPVGSSLELTSPNGGERLTAGNTFTIAWRHAGTVADGLTLSWTADGNSTAPVWNTIVQNLPATGSYDWSVPDTATTTALMAIAVPAGQPRDESDASFTILSEPPTNPELALLAPNGGERFFQGATIELRWQGSDLPTGTSVTAEYSLDASADPISWTTIADDQPASGSHDWTIPTDVASDDCLVRVRSGELTDQSDASFRIVPPSDPELALLAPNGGERFFQGATIELRWQGSDLPTGTSVTAEYSLDASADPISWTTIADDQPASGSHDWTIPTDVASDDCLVRVRSGELTDQSDASFRIVPVGFLIQQPQAGISYGSGLRTTIRWQSDGIQGDIDLAYTLTVSVDDPEWITIVDDAPNVGSYDWIVPATASTDCAIRIAGNSNAVGWVESRSATFAIENAGLSLLQPNGGESLLVGEEFEIRWQRAGVSAPVTLAFSSDADAGEPSWTPIATDVADTGSFVWTVPDTASETCLISIRDPGADLSDRSDAIFSISAPEGIWYVDDDASAGGDGHSWASAFRHPEDALAITESGDQIWIADGIYRPRGNRDQHIAMVSGVALFGGFAGDETTLNQRDWRQQQTVFSGDIGTVGIDTDNSRQVVRLYNVEEVIIDGLVITGGYADGDFERRYGAGIYCNNSNLRLRNCLLIDNHADPDAAAGGTGGGLSAFSSTLEIVNCVFTGNTAPFGAGVALTNAAGQTNHVIGSVFHDNHALWGGGGISCFSNTTIEVRSCSLIDNRAEDDDLGDGGAIYISSDSALIAGNTLFAANTATEATPLLFRAETGSASFAHCQLHDTTPSGPDWDEQFGIDDGGNIAAVELNLHDLATPAGDDGVWATADDGLAPTATSPLVDAGSDSVGGGGGSDLTGGDRRVNSIDIGAYEYQPSGDI